jgi:hypothetical protein
MLYFWPNEVKLNNRFILTTERVGGIVDHKLDRFWPKTFSQSFHLKPLSKF